MKFAKWKNSEANERFPLLTKYMGDWRSLLPGGAAGVMQLMHPAIGAAISQQSDFFGDPMGRIYRSIPQIWSTVLDPDGAERARRIRDTHRSIKGKDEQGRSYHALDPETYWWAHATFTWEVFRSIELMHRGGLASVDVEQLYAESKDWYALYRVSAAPVPADYAAFQAKFAAFINERLEMTPAAERTMYITQLGAWRWPFMKKPYSSPVIGRSWSTIVSGTLPDTVRERFEVPWGRRERGEFAAICFWLREGTGSVPAVLNRQTLELALRYIGKRTRRERISVRQMA